MRLWPRRREAVPEGARVRRGDGSAVECDMLRDRDGDRDGCAMWLAVAREPFEFDPGGDHLEVDMLPGRTIIGFRLPLALPGRLA